MQCETTARTERAPFFLRSSAAATSVPAVSVMSSTRMMSRPSTSPTRLVAWTGGRARAALGDETIRQIEHVGGRGVLQAAHVGREDRGVLEPGLVLDVLVEDRRGVEMVDRDVEEALDLLGVQVDGQDAVGAGGA
jgi:hypothetical protein